MYNNDQNEFKNNIKSSCKNKWSDATALSEVLEKLACKKVINGNFKRSYNYCFVAFCFCFCFCFVCLLFFLCSVFSQMIFFLYFSRFFLFSLCLFGFLFCFALCSPKVLYFIFVFHVCFVDYSFFVSYLCFVTVYNYCFQWSEQLTSKTRRNLCGVFKSEGKQPLMGSQPVDVHRSLSGLITCTSIQSGGIQPPSLAY